MDTGFGHLTLFLGHRNYQIVPTTHPSALSSDKSRHSEPKTRIMSIFFEAGAARQYSDHISRGDLINWSAKLDLSCEDDQALQCILCRTLVRESLFFRRSLDQSRTEIGMTGDGSKLDCVSYSIIIRT
jgi:hypothetical protein